MNDSMYIGAYWERRPEGLVSCARKSFLFMSAAAKSGMSDFSNWYFLGNNESSSARKPIDIIERNILEIMRDDFLARKDPGSLGYRFNVWNGLFGDAAVNISICCGMDSPYIRNSITISYSCQDSLCEVIKYENLRKILDGLVGVWEPDWAVVSNEAYVLDKNVDISKPFGSWVTYVKNSSPMVVSLSSSRCHVERDGKGAYISIKQDGFFSTSGNAFDFAEDITGSLALISTEQ